jgi:hypothetical protein
MIFQRQPEHHFVQDFIFAAKAKKCYVEVIPDPMCINRTNRLRHREKKRPFDLVLICPDNVFCLEAKYGSNNQMSHQEQVEKNIHQINALAYYVIRKRDYKQKRSKYTIEHNHEPVYETDKIEELIDFFMGTAGSNVLLEMDILP